MASNKTAVKSVWFWKPLQMLPGGGATHIGSGPAWRGWGLEVCRLTNELIIIPPKAHPLGRLRVPMTNVAAYQASSATVKSDE